MARQIALRADRLSYEVALPDGKPLHVLNDCSLDVDIGLSTAILGRSGSGKSTLLSLMGLLAPCVRGEIVIDDKPTSRLSDAERTRFRREHLGFVFQSFALLQYLNVLDNVALPLTGRAGIDRRSVKSRCMELLSAVGLSGRSASMPKELSGGEQQRVAIARALINSPRLVLADEPTGSLDHESAAQVMSLLIEQTRLRSAALVVVTHDLELANRLNRRYILTAGSLTESV